MAKEYDYLLKVLLVGDSDVGKTEILSNLDEDPTNCEGNENKNKKFNRPKCWFRFVFSHIQDYYHPSGWQASEATGECDRRASRSRIFVAHFLMFAEKISSDLGRERTRSLLHNNTKLLARRSRDHPSVRYHQQMEFRGH